MFMQETEEKKIQNWMVQNIPRVESVHNLFLNVILIMLLFSETRIFHILKVFSS
jgi:hypothetical protein